MVVAMKSAHRLARRRSVRLRDLEHERLFWFERARQPAFFDHCQQVFADHGFAPATVREPSDHHVLLGHIASGRAVALLPQSFTALRRPGVVYRALWEGDELAVGIGLATAPDQLALREVLLRECRAAGKREFATRQLTGSKRFSRRSEPLALDGQHGVVPSPSTKMADIAMCAPRSWMSILQRRPAWLLWLALLLPLTQAAATLHALSHVVADEQGENEHKGAPHQTDCELDLCLSAATVSGGALPGTPRSLPHPAARRTVPLAASSDIRHALFTQAYRSRAPPIASH
jgi:hypothetical protein